MSIYDEPISIMPIMMIMRHMHSINRKLSNSHTALEKISGDMQNCMHVGREGQATFICVKFSGHGH